MSEVAPAFMRDAIYMIQTVGFPIAVAGFLLWRLNGKISSFVMAAQEINIELRTLGEELRAHRHAAETVSSELHEHRLTAKGWVDELRRDIREIRPR